MRTLRRISASATMLAMLLGLVGGPTVVSAATSPSLGAAASYGILASTYTNTTPTTVNGDVGFTTGPDVAPGGTRDFYGSGAPYSQAGIDQGSALTTGLTPQGCDFSYPAGAIDLSTDNQRPGATVGEFEPGVYCVVGAMSISGPLTLSGTGTYIFRSTGAFTTGDGSIITMAGASSCDVFWTPAAATTLGANTTFFGTVIDDAGITVGANTTWTGRALAFSGTVTTDTDIINEVCATAVPAPAPAPSTDFQQGRITVVKTVINDNGGTGTVADFPLFVNGAPVVSGETNSFIFRPPANEFLVTEITDTDYAATFSGDCDAVGRMNLNAGENLVCIITNDDIGPPVVVPPVPPLIDVVKVPSPLSLPAGPGAVTYTYTLRNIGTVPVTDVTMVGDTCAPITRISGDTNGNNVLEVSETWVYTCNTTLSETHTNTIVATGVANGITATDIANATVVVGVPVVSPLIHITKVPSPPTLSAGGGMVTYTKTVTNPGTVPISNVRITDDQCSPVTFISGDTNGDAQLDTTETWTYTCQANVTATRTNTANASGEANGFITRDFAIAPVVVAAAVPALPVTGFAPEGNVFAWLAVAAGIFTLLLLISIMRRKQTR